MRVVLQRVKHARVDVGGKTVGEIQKGLLLLVGIHERDTAAQADFLAAKCADIRVFSDDEGRMNLSVKDVGGDILAVSQFTLYGNCKKGRRPSYTQAAKPQKGRELYEYFVKKTREQIDNVQTGIFGAMMDVALVNDGPVTLILEKEPK
jgi:D-tyrosyl-tRNA(Tyr) deacylase